MANTEIMNALRIVREAENLVTDALDVSGLTGPQRAILDDLSDILREIDNLLLLNALNESIDALKNKSKKLKSINDRMQKQIEKLEAVADKAEKVAKAIDALVKAFGVLASASLI